MVSRAELDFRDERNAGSRTRRFRPWANIVKLFRRKESTAGAEHLRRDSQRKRTSLRKTSMLSSSVSFDCLKKQATELPTSQPKPIPGRSFEEEKPASRLSESQESRDSVFEIAEIECHDAANSESTPEATTSPPLKIPVNHLAELRAAIRRRRSSDDCEEEDLGLPRSPASATLASAEVLSSSLLNHGNATRSTGSDASLLSMDAMENEEELPNSITSGLSSYGSLEQEARIQMLKQDKKHPDGSDDDNQLSHSAARHKISVRPKKTHALPRYRRPQQVTATAGELPVTAELTENLVPTSTESSSATFQETRKKVDATQASTEQVGARALETGKPQPHQSRSQSLTRSDLSSSQTRGSAASSTKLARSKSSVDKKIQYEVVSFWRRIREKEEAAENSPGLKTLSPSSSQTRKSKHSKEDKKKQLKENTEVLDSSFDSTDSSVPQPFLSRIFGSKRSSSRRKQDSKPDSATRHVDHSVDESPRQIRQQNKELETIEVAPETISSARNAEEVEEKITLPRFSGPQHQKRITTLRKAATDTPTFELATDDVPSNKAEELGTKQSPASSNRAKIHIAGLSPYQRRVARIGNSLDIDTDAEFDESLRKANRQQLIDSLKLQMNKSTGTSEARKDSLSATRNHDLDQLTVAKQIEKGVDMIKDESASSLSDSEVHEIPISSPTLSNKSLSEDVQDKSLEKLSDCEEVFVEVSRQVHASSASPTQKPRPQEDSADGKQAEKSSLRVPEFLQVQLQKVELKPSTNVVFDTEMRTNALAPKGVRKQRAKSFETGDLHKTSRVTRLEKREPGVQPTVSERDEVLADNSSGVFVMNVRIRNTVSAAPFLGRTLSSPAERGDVRPVVVLVKNGVPTITDVPKSNDHEHPGRHVKDPFQPLPRPRLNAEDQSWNAPLSLKAAEVDVTDAPKEIQDIQDSPKGVKVPLKPLQKDKSGALTSMENHTEVAGSTDMKLRHRGNKEIPLASIQNEPEPPELIKVFARRSLKLSEEVVCNDATSTAAVSNSNRALDTSVVNYSLEETLSEKVSSTTEDYENFQNVWKRMVPQKKILSKNQSLASEEKLKNTENVEVARTFQTRQSKVLDLVHNFQRLQVL